MKCENSLWCDAEASTSSACWRFTANKNLMWNSDIWISKHAWNLTETAEWQKLLNANVSLNSTSSAILTAKSLFPSTSCTLVGALDWHPDPFIRFMISKHCRRVKQLWGLNHAGKKKKKKKKWTFEEFTLDGAMGAWIGLQSYCMGATNYYQRV